ncbi:MAG: DUF4249 domain-containing protein [Chlorobi bacterium]|nr:DUF4249 domain-containing protein [Chlorobiota bacterium]
MRNHLYVLILLLLFSSCEEVVDISLKNVQSAVVVEATVTNLPGGQTVKISTTTDYYNPSLPLMKQGAEVSVLDDLGNSWLFNEISKGVYTNGNLTGKEGRKYTLEVKVDGKDITGESEMQTVTPIDSIRSEYFPGTRFADPGYFVIIMFTDPPGEDPDYYRIRMFNGQKPNPVIQLVDDRLTNGNQMEFFLYGGSYQPGDTAIVELQSIDYGTYIYFYTLSNVLASDQQGATSTPANPNTNLSDDALGYFGAIAISRDTLVIRDHD